MKRLNMQGSQQWKVLLFMVCLIAFASPAFGQAVYGTIYGTVTDPTGAAVPDATVTITDTAKGTSVTVTSNGSGGYSAEHLIPDSYDVKVAATGFKASETKGIQVFADTSPKVDAELQPGGSNETVEVRADTLPDLKTDRADVSTVFNERTIEDLPIAGRNFTTLQLLLPGTQLLGWSHAASENPQASQQIIVNGQHFAGTAYELDGTDNQDPILGIIVVNPALDAISEAKITTQNYDAQFGKAVSAVITAQTKSGGNKFHGTAFDYRRSDAQVARDPFTQGNRDALSHRFVPPAIYSQFGGSIGGPIIRDKFFFFGDYQGVRQKVGTSVFTNVPTNLVRSSCATPAGCNFSEYAVARSFDPNNFIFDPQTGTAYPNATIPANQLSPQALAILARIPAPNAAGTVNNFTASGSGLFNNNQFDIRLDGQISDKLHSFLRYSRFADTLSGKTAFGTAGGTGFGIGGFGGTSLGTNSSFAAGIDYALNANLLTDVRAGYFRYKINTSKFDQSQQTANTYGIPGLNQGTNFTSGSPGFFINDKGGNNGDGLSNVGSGLGVNRCNCPLIENEDQYQIANNWTKVLGNHAVKFGADLRYARNLRVPSDANRAGELTFAANETAGTAQLAGLGLATFVLGDVTNFSRYFSSSTNAKEFQKRTFFYVQDTYRVTSKLTVNAGVRWEIYFPEAVNGKGNGALLDLATGNLRVAGFGAIGTNLNVDKDYKAFAPRIGVAYQATPTTVVRAGYGRSFDIGVFGSIFGHTLTQNLPVLGRQNLNYNGGTSPPEFTLQSGPTAAVFPAVPANGLLPLPIGINGRARPTKIILPTIDAWNLSVQQQLGKSYSFTLAYVGNKGSHTFAGDNPDTNANQPAIAANGVTFTPNSNSNLRRRFFPTRQWTQDITYFHDGGDTHFNALDATIEKRFSSGAQFTANYAWQRAYNYDQDYFEVDKHVTYGPVSDLRTNQFTLFGNYELPFGRGRQFASGINPILNYIIGGYQLSGDVNVSGGLPFTPSYRDCGQDRDTGPCRPNGDAGNFPHKLGSFVPGFGRTFFTPVNNGSGLPGTGNPNPGGNSGPFSRPAVATFGNVGRNSLRGPNFWNSNLSLLKSFPIKESVTAQFRVNAFNVFNHINPGNPNSQCIDCSVSTNAGVITGEAVGATPRQLEFAIRLQF